MLRRLLILSALLTVFIIVAGLVLWVRNLTPQAHRFVFSNGSVVTFQQATFGTNHTVSGSIGARWQKYVPKIFARWLDLPRAASSFSTPSPAVMLWFERWQIPGANTGQDYGCSLVHADGTETSFESSRHYATWTPTNTLEGTPSAYPQREKLLHVRFYERKNYDDVTLLGEFTVRNPAVSRAPIQIAPPLPHHTNDGDLGITLVSLESPAPRNKWDKTNFMNQWTRARFLVTEAGVPSTAWGVAGLTATDSTGNRLVANAWSGSGEKKLEGFDCKPLLWPSETYRLRYEFSRKTEALFDTNEVWIIHGVAVPTNGGFTLVNTQWQTGKFTVRFHGVNSKDGKPPWESHYGGESSVSFSVMPAPEGHRFTLVSVTDERGRKVENSGSSYSDTNWAFGLRLKDDSEKLNVTVALHHSRFVEFTAQPVKWAGKFSP